VRTCDLSAVEKLTLSTWRKGVVTVRRLAVRVQNSHVGDRIREIWMHCLCYRHVVFSVAWVSHKRVCRHHREVKACLAGLAHLS